MPPIQAIGLAKELEPYNLFFLEDPFAPENNGYFPLLRQQTSIPIAMGELYVNTSEYVDLIKDRMIDFIRCHISDIGGLTPARKLAAFCEYFGVRTAWHGPGDTSPVGHAANLQLDLVAPNFGIQELAVFKDRTMAVFPGCPEVRDGMLWSNERPGLGIDLDETEAAKYPLPGPYSQRSLAARSPAGWNRHHSVAPCRQLADQTDPAEDRFRQEICRSCDSPKCCPRRRTTSGRWPVSLASSTPSRLSPVIDVTSRRPRPSLEALLESRQRFADHGLKLEVLETAFPMLTTAKWQTSGDDVRRQVDEALDLIRIMGEADVRVACWNWMAVFNWTRTALSQPTRGGAVVTAYNHTEMAKEADAPEAPITEDQLWEGLHHFMEAAVPVAEAAGVTLALHPDDPPISPIRGRRPDSDVSRQPPASDRPRSQSGQRPDILPGHDRDDGRRGPRPRFAASVGRARSGSFTSAMSAAHPTTSPRHSMTTARPIWPPRWTPGTTSATPVPADRTTSRRWPARNCANPATTTRGASMPSATFAG